MQRLEIQKVSSSYSKRVERVFMKFTFKAKNESEKFELTINVKGKI